jgi:hypothetical protein
MLFAVTWESIREDAMLIKSEDESCHTKSEDESGRSGKVHLPFAFRTKYATIFLAVLWFRNLRIGKPFGSPLHLVQDELGRAMNAFPEIATLFCPKRASHVGEKMVVPIPV